VTSLLSVAETSRAVAAARGRNEKRDRIADLLRVLEPDVRAIGIAYLVGELVQGKIGVGWAAIRDLETGAPRAEASLTLMDVHRTFDAIAAVKGAGSTAERARLLGALFARATETERTFLVALLGGGLRQGALDGVVLDAIAVAAKLPAADVRRAAMLGGSIPTVGADLLAHGREALARYDLVPFRPILPMLASPIGDVEEALGALGEAALEQKIDGARLQVHKDGDDVRLYTRSLHDVTSRAPEIVSLVRSLPARSLVLDGEAIALDANGKPHPFQTTMRRFGRRGEADALRTELPLSALFFDAVHVDGRSMLDAPLRERRAALEAVVPEHARIRSIVTSELDEAEAFYAATIAHGHEGLMAKSLAATYEAGARGASWLKIKPAHTLDLVVLAVERGSGRRTGWLSNLHLGARDPEHGGFVMLGKTFKGMTDAMLTWQTEKLRALAASDDGYVVHVRPELVVEIAFNDVQESPHYPGGLALRFARVKRYREDKRAADADTIDTVRTIFAKSRER
jgi:DNA ligase-1